MRFLGAAAAVLAAVSCSGDATGPSRGGVPARLEIAGGDLQQALVGTELAQPLVARVLDSKGKPVSGQLVNFVVAAGGGQVFAGSAITNAAGEARERWTLGTVADTQRVEVRAVDPTTGQPLVFAAFRAVGMPDVAATVGPQSATALAGFPGLPLADSVAVVVKDRFGNPVPGVAVVWTVRRGGGSVSPASSTTGAGGVARTVWTLGLALDSTQVLEAAAGLTLKGNVVANGQLPADARLVKVSGDLQTGAVGQPLAQPLVVRVQHADGTPIANAPVTFTTADYSGSFNPGTAVSDAAGLVSVQWLIPGVHAPNAFQAYARIPGQAVEFIMHATAAAPAVVRLKGRSPEFQVYRKGDVGVEVLDGFGNPVQGQTVAWTASNGVMAPATTVTDGYEGSSWAAWTPGAPGTGQVTATAGPAHATIDIAAQYLSLEVKGPAFATYDVTYLVAIANTTRPGDTIRYIRANYAGRETEVVKPPYGANMGQRDTYLDLTGLPYGLQPLRFWTVSAMGDSVEKSFNVVHLMTPIITVTSPAENATSGQQVQFDASCTQCVSMTVTSDSRGILASGGTSIHATAAMSPGTWTLRFTARSRVDGQYEGEAYVERSVKVSATP
jgi:hypothetical protein